MGKKMKYKKRAGETTERADKRKRQREERGEREESGASEKRERQFGRVGGGEMVTDHGAVRSGQFKFKGRKNGGGWPNWVQVQQTQDPSLAD